MASGNSRNGDKPMVLYLRFVNGRSTDLHLHTLTENISRFGFPVTSFVQDRNSNAHYQASVWLFWASGAEVFVNELKDTSIAEGRKLVGDADVTATEKTVKQLAEFLRDTKGALMSNVEKKKRAAISNHLNMTIENVLAP